MKNSQTLSVKKPAAQLNPDHKQRPEKSFIGKTVTLQTKSPTRIVGEVVSFDNGWLVIVGDEYRWLSDGSLSACVASGKFSLDRSNITYICEVE